MVFFSYFEQLYELDNDPQRKEFLDDLFVFMQKRGMLSFIYLFCGDLWELLLMHLSYFVNCSLCGASDKDSSALKTLVIQNAY